MFGWLSGKRRRRERLIRQTTACCAIIKEKWQWYNETLVFKEDVSLAERVASFAIPINEAIRKNYPELVSPEGGTVMTLIMITLASQDGVTSEVMLNACAEAAQILGVVPEPMTVLV